MNSRKLGALVLGLSLARGIPVGAQTPESPTSSSQASGSGRPYEGLFGGGDETGASVGRTGGHTLNLTTTFAGAYDDDIYGDRAIGVGPSRPQVSDVSAMLLASVDYTWRGRRLQVGATAGSALRYYSKVGELENVSETVGLGLSAQFARRTTLFLNQTVAYSPSYLYALFPTVGQPGPGDVPPAAPDYSAYNSESYSYGTTASISRGLSRRGQLTAGVDYQFTDYQHELFFQRDLRAFGAQAQFSRNLTRNAALGFGYRFRTSDYYFALGRQATEHGLDIRMDYSRPLSATRQVTFGFSLGPGAVETPTAFESVGTLERQYRLLGEAHFGYQFSRMWRAQGSYSRSFEYVPGLREPVYADGVTGVVDGLFSRRWEFRASASFSDGESALVRSAAFSTYTGNARLRYALSSMWALYGEYLYYYYDFRGTAQLPLGVPPVLERNGVRIGLTLWVPVKRR